MYSFNQIFIFVFLLFQDPLFLRQNLLLVEQFSYFFVCRVADKVIFSCSKVFISILKQILGNFTPVFMFRINFIQIKANDIYEKFKSPARLRNSPVNKDILRGDDMKGYERVLRRITEDLHLPWAEYWAFLDSYCNFQSHEGLDKLEIYFRQRRSQQVLDAQVSAIQTFRSERTIQVTAFATVEQPSLTTDHLVIKLDAFLKLVEQLRAGLDLRENQLSGKFERFVKFMEENQTTDLSSLTGFGGANGETDGPDSDLLSEACFSHHSELAVNDTLRRYMSVIVELSRTDTSSKCYFGLYKTSKQLLDLLNCQKLFESFYLSPVYRQKTGGGESVVSTSKPLDINRSRRVKFGADLVKSISFDSDEDEDESSTARHNRPKKAAGAHRHADLDEEDDELKDEEDAEDNDDANNMLDAEDSRIDDIYEDSQGVNDDDLDQLTSAMQASSVKSPTEIAATAKLRPSLLKNNPFGGSSDHEVLNGSQRTVTERGVPYRAATESAAHSSSLFVYGDVPSKLDRAVFLAIQELKERSRYPLVTVWYDYMKNCKQSEMQQWKTPMRKNTVRKIS
jgi:hypothetical protein